MAIDRSDPVKYLEKLRELQAKRKANWQKRAAAARAEKKRTKAALRAFNEARRNVLVSRRGLALIAAYDDPDLSGEFRKEYCRILAREGIEPF